MTSPHSADRPPRCQAGAHCGTRTGILHGGTCERCRHGAALANMDLIQKLRAAGVTDLDAAARRIGLGDSFAEVGRRFGVPDDLLNSVERMVAREAPADDWPRLSTRRLPDGQTPAPASSSTRPSHLPKLRDQTAAHLADPDHPIRTDAPADLSAALDAATGHLHTADMYWVAPDMTALAMHAGQQLAAARWATADRPAPAGLIYFDGGVGSVDYQDVSIPIDALTWGPHNGGLLLWAYLSRRRLAATIAPAGMELVVEQTPPLLPFAAQVVPVTADAVPLADTEGPIPSPVLATLAASWLLMQQPKLIDRTTVPADKPIRRAHTRAGRPAPEVTLVDLRHQYVPQDRDPDAGSDGSRYRHRC